jgi:hypothetical protein
MENPGIVKQNGSPFLTPFYFLVSAAALAYIVYIYAFNFDSYSEAELMVQSYYFVPPTVFSLIGLFTRNNGKSLIYALLGGIGSYALLFAFFATIWDSL